MLFRSPALLPPSLSSPLHLGPSSSPPQVGPCPPSPPPPNGPAPPTRHRPAHSPPQRPPLLRARPLPRPGRAGALLPRAVLPASLGRSSPLPARSPAYHANWRRQAWGGGAFRASRPRTRRKPTWAWLRAQGAGRLKERAAMQAHGDRAAAPHVVGARAAGATSAPPPVPSPPLRPLPSSRPLPSFPRLLPSPPSPTPLRLLLPPASALSLPPSLSLLLTPTSPTVGHHLPGAFLGGGGSLPKATSSRRVPTELNQDPSLTEIHIVFYCRSWGH